jgi:outer membrane receptor protein involved in Fe transport
MPFVFVDFNTRFVISGNDELKRATIQNYDFRYEVFPGNGQLFSVSAFYKNFNNPIEQYVLPGVSSSDGLQVSYRNQESARNVGLETEFRLVLGKLNGNEIENVWDKVTVFSNLALIRSQVSVKYNDTASITRQLQGQSPYVFNGGVTYWDEAKKFNVSLMANRVGQRISVVGSVNQFGTEDEPTLWENGRTVIDLSVTKSFLKEKLEVRLSGRDLLAQRQYFYWDLNGNGKLDADAGGYGNITETKKTLVDRIVDPITANEVAATGAAPKDIVRWSTVFGRTINLQLTYKF